MRKKIKENNLDWEVDSAGTGSWHIGERPDKRSIAKAQDYGIDITKQRARQFQKSDFEDFDHILVMDSSNFSEVIRLASNDSHKEKVAMIMNYHQEGMNQSIPDPYWGDSGFEEVYQMLDKACDGFINIVTSDNH